MPVSKTGALPLGDTPMTVAENRKLEEMWLGYLDSNQGMPVSKTGALPLGDTPTKFPNGELQARSLLAVEANLQPGDTSSVQRFYGNGAGGET